MSDDNATDEITAIQGEFVKSIGTNIKERLSSPLFGAFAISWLNWNFRLLMVVFDSQTIGEKFDTIDKVLYPTINPSIHNG